MMKLYVTYTVCIEAATWEEAGHTMSILTESIKNAESVTHVCIEDCFDKNLSLE